MAKLTRRAFVAGAGASAAGVGLVSAGRLSARAAETAGAGPQVLRAAPTTAQLLEADQPPTPVWAYNGSVPGPEIRIPRGKPFAARLQNGLDAPTTIHWHGVRNENAMDGAAGLTQPPVAPGEVFDYAFTPPDAGTFWYHPHFRTYEQLARGLAGAFIVTEDNPPPVDRDVVLVFDDWRIREDTQIDGASFGAFHDLSHAGRLGNVLTLNGAFSYDLDVRAGDRLRLRLLNASTARVLRIALPGHRLRVVALDGAPVTPFDAEDIRLAPAQRCDVVVDCMMDVGTRTPIIADTGRKKLEAGYLAYDAAKRQRTAVLGDPIVLNAWEMPGVGDTSAARRDLRVVDLVMDGGARTWLDTAQYEGETLDARTLARQHGKVWAFNGIVGKPDEPLARFARDEPVEMRLVNRTAWPHAMHFHGHHVREIARGSIPQNGLDNVTAVTSKSVRAGGSGHWRDTVYLRPQEMLTVGFVAHNPGLWMLHCHMLAHQLGGMATWYEVA
ncbi:MAG: multicopper oxidase family protein [Pseudomonadota bacterium]